MKHLLFELSWQNLLCWIAGAIWTWIEPTLPFAALCVFAVVVDCISAIRLNRRVRRKYGDKASDGKIKSQHMSQMTSDLFMLFGVMLIAQGINQFVITAWDVPLGNFVACVFLLYTILSILENESSTNDNKWAVILQRVIADKTKRHLDVDLSEVISHKFTGNEEEEEQSTEEEEEIKPKRTRKRKTES